MSWTCEQVEASLSEYLDGLLGEGARREFDAHANHCDRCGPLVARVSGVVSGLHRLELLEEPPELASIILAKTPGTGLENKKLPQSSPDNPPGMTNGPQRNQPRELNRADQLHPELSVLASALPSAWERSLP